MDECLTKKLCLMIRSIFHSFFFKMKEFYCLFFFLTVKCSEIKSLLSSAHKMQPNCVFGQRLA